MSRTPTYPISYGPTAPVSYSSRSSYPTFLSLPDTLKLHIHFFWRGIVDASRWDTTLRVVYSDTEIRSHVLKSFTLNTLSLISIYTFDFVLLPLVQGQHNFLHRNVGWIYKVLWLIPLAAASFYLNGSWAGVVAKRSYILQHGTRSTVPSHSYTGMLTAIASSAYRVVMIMTSIILTFSLAYIPIVGAPFGFAFLCFVNAYYCFEFTWVARGQSLAQRVRFVEERWAYFFAFGMPSAAMCACCSSLAGAALFALLLPYYIIKAVHARPVPAHPYSPLSSSSTPAYDSRASNSSVLYPSPFVPIRIPVFSMVITIDNLVVRLLSVGSSSSKGMRAGMRVDMDRWQLPGDPDVATNAEEGNFSRISKHKASGKLD